MLFIVRKIPNGEQNVEREIHLLQALAHKNVMKLIEVFYNDAKGKIYLVRYIVFLFKVRYVDDVGEGK